MLIGNDRLASQRFAYSSHGYGTTPLFSILLSNQDLPRIFLMKAFPFDNIAGSEVEINYSSGSEYPYFGGHLWPARLNASVNITNDLFGSAVMTESGSVPTFGNLSLLIGDEDNDHLTQYLWDGRTVEILMGSQEFSLEDFKPVMTATVKDITWDDDSLTLSIRDYSAKFDKPIQQSLYAGTGGLEGGADIANSAKPICLGSPKNTPLVLLDAVNNVYQYHDGQSLGYIAVYDGGIQLDLNSLFQEGMDVYEWEPEEGTYIYDSTHGAIRLGAQPAGTITADPRGYISAQSSASDLIKYIVTTYSDLTTEDIDTVAFDKVRVSNPSPLSLYINDGTTTIANALTMIMDSIGGYWTYTTNGLLTIGIFDFDVPVLTVNNTKITKISRIETPAPIWRCRMGYSKCYQVQGENDVSAGIISSRRSFIANEYRYTIVEDGSVKDRRLLAEEQIIYSLFNSKSDAQTETNRRFSLLKEDRDIYELTCKKIQFKVGIGTTVTVDYPRFGMPKDYIVIGLTEDTINSETILKVWG